MTNWRELLESAWADRKQWIQDPNSNSWRLFHGYDEGFPGVVIEKFATLATIEYKVDIRNDIDQIKNVLLELFPFETIVAKGHQSLGLSLKDRLFAVHGKLDQEPTIALDNAVKYAIRGDTPHNSGLYLDARPVRRWLRAHSNDRRVLNLFAFTGSLGIAALVGGAKDVTHLDKSKELVPRIKLNYQLNGLRWDDRSFLRGDIYKHLPRAIRSGQRFDGIILDPPPKVYQSSYTEHKPQGQDFYQLVGLCSQLLNPGAWLLCMFHRFDADWDSFETQVCQASKVELKPVERFTSEDDFPESNSENKLRVSVFQVPKVP